MLVFRIGRDSNHSDNFRRRAQSAFQRSKNGSHLRIQCGGLPGKIQRVTRRFRQSGR